MSMGWCRGVGHFGLQPAREVKNAACYRSRRCFCCASTEDRASAAEPDIYRRAQAVVPEQILPKVRAPHRFMTWLAQPPCGVDVSRVQVTKQDGADASQLCVVSKYDIPPGQTIVKIPAELGIWMLDTSSADTNDEDAERHGANVRLAEWILGEWHEDRVDFSLIDRKQYEPYLNLLPTWSQAPVCVCTNEELAELEIPHDVFVAHVLASAFQDVMLKMSSSNSGHTVKSMQSALGAALSRPHNVSLTDSRDNSLRSYTVLVPLLDFINHSCTPNASWFYDDAEKEFLVYASTSIRAGDQICVSYGLRPSSEWSLFYGFVPTTLTESSTNGRKMGLMNPGESVVLFEDGHDFHDWASRRYIRKLGKHGVPEPFASLDEDLRLCIDSPDDALQIACQAFRTLLESHGMHVSEYEMLSARALEILAGCKSCILDDVQFLSTVHDEEYVRGLLDWDDYGRVRAIMFSPSGARAPDYNRQNKFLDLFVLSRFLQKKLLWSYILQEH
ncbi:hypothetical protein FVE85_7392 [Porphyridium purpureum]|uniref:SET domain-containing protein n=1 Tax=Porphyridium purpureum TaxID=35688 RepID=A0A5J4ZAY8_PORPP|nr:hypothetical protein FVE85_7392 [Porphyridium purpureum]|eukprot:POR4749..scf295_1